MKVAIVTPTLSHFEVPLFRLAASLDGLDVRVFHTDLREDTFLDKDYSTLINWGENMRRGYPNTGFDSIRQLHAAVLDWSPRVVLQYGYFWKGAFGLLARMRLHGIPVVHRGLLTPYFNTQQNLIVTHVWRRVQPLLLRRFQAHHYGGSYSEAVLEAAGIPRDERYFVPYSVDSPYFSKLADDPEQALRAVQLKRSLGWPDDSPVLLFMCQHSWFKAPDVMMRVAAKAQRLIPDVKLVMAGSGRMTEELKSYAAAHLFAGSYHFPGYVSSKHTMPYYLAADLVLFPSRYDTWSRGVNEAMLARRPCIVSRIVPAAGGLVDHETNGYVVDSLEPAQFVELVMKFLLMPVQERRRMGEAARMRAEEFSYEAHVDDLRRSFTECAMRLS
jgi:glycosyltransferase involved in cell wall biosynthesis